MVTLHLKNGGVFIDWPDVTNEELVAFASIAKAKCMYRATFKSLKGIVVHA